MAYVDVRIHLQGINPDTPSMIVLRTWVYAFLWPVVLFYWLRIKETIHANENDRCFSPRPYGGEPSHGPVSTWAKHHQRATRGHRLERATSGLWPSDPMRLWPGGVFP